MIGYKYVRVFFSEPLSSLDTSEVEIRGTKNNQLYSLESVKLSSTGLFADVILYGSYDADGTTFLMPNTPYVATIDHDGMVDSLEFELPATAADLVVVSVDADEKKITIDDSERTQHIVPRGKTEFSLGDTYEGNIGELLGRTVNFEYNADDVITKLTVQDETVVIDTMKYVDPNKNGLDKKDYMVNNTGDKYYFEQNNTATKNATHFVLANNTSDDFEVAPLGAADGTDDGKPFDYVRLTLNPTGTIATMTFNEAVTDFLMVESVNDQVVIADKNTSMNFGGYAIFEGEALISTDDLEVGDVVYWSVGDDFAYVYADSVTGEMDNVIHEKLDLDGTTYTWTNAKYYDDGSSKYVTLKAGTEAESVASQKYLNSLDPDEVTITLKMNGDIAYVDGEVVGESETETTTYLLTKAAEKEKVGFDETMKLSVNDGSDSSSITFKPGDLKSVDGEAGKVTDVNTTTNWFTFEPTDGDPAAITKVKTNNYKYAELIDVTTNASTGAVVGLKELDSSAAIGKTITATSTDDKINSNTKTVAAGSNTYAVTGSTKVWVVVGAGPTDKDKSAASVKMVKFSDFAQGTAPIGTTIDGGAAAAFTAYVYPDKANAKHIVIVQTYDDANPDTAHNKKSKTWETGETTDILGVVVGETKVAKSDGTDALVVKTITVQDATGAKITLDADGNVDETVYPGQLINVTYTNSDTKVVGINDTLAWSLGTQNGAVEYDSSVIKLNGGTALRPYTNCMILKHYTIGGDDKWDPITISEINSSKNGWNVKEALI